MTKSLRIPSADVQSETAFPEPTAPPTPRQPAPDQPPQKPARSDAAPAPVPFARLCLRRPRAALGLLACVVQVWLMHGAHVLRCRLRARFGSLAADDGMTTAEYAVGTVAACGFAALLYKVVTSGAVSSALQGLIRRALGAV
ncbi:Protein of unknown function [Streptacidiphilus jiangxiensis]|uniref:DUF4244 domain-containing protein n=2 Tax=Streptacidiphilus jiangxiensis TaxID=235985 RepID=A0A1H7PWQ2_STRJI|nr:Protein of unknown function [Streptacidiphilus jiangxiensis]